MNLTSGFSAFIFVLDMICETVHIFDLWSTWSRGPSNRSTWISTRVTVLYTCPRILRRRLSMQSSSMVAGRAEWSNSRSSCRINFIISNALHRIYNRCCQTQATLPFAPHTYRIRPWSDYLKVERPVLYGQSDLDGHAGGDAGGCGIRERDGTPDSVVQYHGSRIDLGSITQTAVVSGAYVCFARIIDFHERAGGRSARFSPYHLMKLLAWVAVLGMGWEESRGLSSNITHSSAYVKAASGRHCGRWFFPCDHVCVNCLCCARGDKLECLGLRVRKLRR